MLGFLAGTYPCNERMHMGKKIAKLLNKPSPTLAHETVALMDRFLSTNPIGQRTDGSHVARG